MEFTDKRKAKQLSRILFILGYSFMLAFGVFAIGGMVLAVTVEEGQELPISGTLILILAITSIVLCIAAGGTGQYYLNKRLWYKNAIDEYRQCLFFTTSLKKTLAGDKKSRNAAVDYYDLITEDTPRRRFMFAFIVAASYYSKDKKSAKKGRDRLDSILETYDPEKVQMCK